MLRLLLSSCEPLSIAVAQKAGRDSCDGLAVDWSGQSVTQSQSSVTSELGTVIGGGGLSDEMQSRPLKVDAH